MNITLNGKLTKIDDGILLDQFLKSKEIEREGIVIQLNGEVLSSDKLDHELNDRDVINIFKVAGGG